MQKITDNEKQEASSFFTGLWNFLKQYYHPETDSDWATLLDASSKLPKGESGTLFHAFALEMTIAVINFIDKSSRH